MDDTRFSAEIQGRVSQFKGFLLNEGFSRPMARCASEVVLALLKCRHVHVAACARALGEQISGKKTWERLRRGLSRVGLWERLTEAHLKRHAGQIRRMRYCVMDISDVQKSHATKADGLGLVRDGSKGSRDRVGPGWWWITGVMSDGKGLLPVHSELFSVQAEAAAFRGISRTARQAAGRSSARCWKGIRNGGASKRCIDRSNRTSTWNRSPCGTTLPSRRWESW